MKRRRGPKAAHVVGGILAFLLLATMAACGGASVPTTAPPPASAAIRAATRIAHSARPAYGAAGDGASSGVSNRATDSDDKCHSCTVAKCRTSAASDTTDDPTFARPACGDAYDGDTNTIPAATTTALAVDNLATGNTWCNGCGTKPRIGSRYPAGELGFCLLCTIGEGSGLALIEEVLDRRIDEAELNE